MLENERVEIERGWRCVWRSALIWSWRWFEMGARGDRNVGT